MNYKNNPHEIEMKVMEEMYDEVQLEMFEENDVRSLVRDLVEYSNSLVEEILDLRKMVNKYDQQIYMKTNKKLSHYQAPYADLYSDFLLDFTGHKIYDKFKDELDELY